MNAIGAPQRGHSLRDPFTAFACDDATAEQIKAVVAELGWPQDKVNRGGLRHATQALSVTTSPSILLVDLSESGDPLADINGLAEVCEPGTVVIAMGQINDVRLYRELLASGIQDYLLKPLNPDMLRDSFSQAQAMLNAPRLSEAANGKPHLAVAVIGVRGGVGATTLATSLAWLIAKDGERSTALLDLDLHFGAAGLSFDIEPGRGLTDAIENPSRIDGLFIERAFVKASEHLAVLSTEAPLSNAYLSDGTAFLHLQEEIRNAYESTVIDLPRDLVIRHPHLLAEVNAVILVCEMSLVCARDLIRMLSWVKSTAPQATLLVACNKMGPVATQEISRKDFEGSIERPIDLAIPLDLKTMVQAAKTGKVVAEIAKSGKLIQALKSSAGSVLALVADGEDADEKTKGKNKGGGSLLGFLGGGAKPDKAGKPAKGAKSA